MIRFDKDFGKSNVNALVAYEYSDRYYKYSRAQVFGVVPGTDILILELPQEQSQVVLNMTEHIMHFCSMPNMYMIKIFCSGVFKK